MLAFAPPNTRRSDVEPICLFALFAESITNGKEGPNINGVRSSFIVDKQPLGQGGKTATLVVGIYADVGKNRHLGFRVNEEVQLPAEFVFALAVSACLDTPASLFVRLLSLATVRPSFERGGVQSNALTERWQSGVMSAYQFTGNPFDVLAVLLPSQFAKESAQCGFMGYARDVADTTQLRDSWAILECSDKSNRRIYCR